MSSPRPIDVIENHLSVERLVRYRQALTGGGDTAAVNAYIWNVGMSAALLEVISYVEIPLRNALAHELEQLATKAADGRTWWEHSEWFDAKSQEDIDKAITKLLGRGRSITHGRLVAELNLGFWRYLLDKRNDRTLWRFALYRAFPNLPVSRSDLYRAVAMMNELRNRIAHHEPIFWYDHVRDADTILDVAGWICADYRTWAQTKSRVGAIVAMKPAGLR